MIFESRPTTVDGFFYYISCALNASLKFVTTLQITGFSLEHTGITKHFIEEECLH